MNRGLIARRAKGGGGSQSSAIFPLQLDLLPADGHVSHMCLTCNIGKQKTAKVILNVSFSLYCLGKAIGCRCG